MMSVFCPPTPLDCEHQEQRDPFLSLMGLALTKHLCPFNVPTSSFTRQKRNGCLSCAHSSDRDRGGISNLMNTWVL